MLKKIFINLCFIFFSIASIFAFPEDKWKTAIRPDYTQIDAYVKECGINCGSTPQEVAKKVTEICTSDIEKARAIFDWLAYNISYDTSYSIHSSKETFKKKKGVCQGYAELYRTMATSVGLNCIMVTGEAKGTIDYKAGEKTGGHAWNLISLEDREILLDSTWGAGFVQNGSFIRKFKPEWFDPHPAIYIFTHRPDSSEYQLLEPLVSSYLFEQLPDVDPIVCEMGFDPCYVYTFFMEHPEHNEFTIYSSFYGSLRKQITFLEMPLQHDLNINEPYTIKLKSDLEVEISNTIDKQIDENGIQTFIIQSSSTAGVHIKLLNKSSYLLGYSIVKDRKKFSKREPLFVQTPIYRGFPEAMYLLMEYIQTGESFFEGFLISNTEVPVSHWNKFGKKLEHKGWSDWDPVYSIKLRDACNYCNYKSTEDGLNECYTFLDNKILCDFSANGYRLPTVNELKKIYESYKDIDIADYAWSEKNSSGYINLIAERAKDSFNLYDILGNAREICYDPELDVYGTMGGSYRDSVEEILSFTFHTNEEESLDIDKPIDLAGIRLVLNGPKSTDEILRFGELYYSGGKVQQDFNKAFLFFEKAALENKIEALNYLGVMYKDGLGCEQNNQKALKCFEKAADKDKYASYNLALSYYFGNLGNEIDYEKAFNLFMKSAEMGHASAQRVISDAYHNGEFYEKNDELAFSWITKAVENGDIQSKEILASFYLNGIGTEIDKEKAFSLYKEAAIDGSVTAMEKTGDCFFYGIGTKQNYINAKLFYTNAKEKGSTYSEVQLTIIDFYQNFNLKGLKKCLEDFQKIKDSGNTSVEEYIEKIQEISLFCDKNNIKDNDSLNTITNSSTPYETIKIYNRLQNAVQITNGNELDNPFVFSTLSKEEIETKILSPMEALSLYKQNEKTDFVFSDNSKIAIIEFPSNTKSVHNFVKNFFKDDFFTGKKLEMNKEWYRFDESIYEYYDYILFCRQDGLASFFESFSKMIGLNSSQENKTAFTSQVDFICLGASLYGNDWLLNKDDFSNLLCKQIDNGLAPRIIGLFDKSDNLQIKINELLPESYAPKVHVFGSPMAMTGEVALGFRKKNLLVCMVTKSFNSSKTLRVYIDETGGPKNEAVSSFILSDKRTKSLKELAVGKEGIFAKPGNIVMYYKIVKPAKK